MKQNLLLTVFSTVILTATSFAGGKNVVPPSTPPPPPSVFGTGWYFGLQAGINAYQNFGGSREFNFGGAGGRVSNDGQVGFAGGLKTGYVFGTGTVRPAIEADLFYNGVRADADIHLNGRDTKISGDANLHSGAFMGNFLLRFAFDRFQPYLGAGAGVWVAKAEDIDVTVNGRDLNLGDAARDNGFAWQIVGGADYYFTEKVSAFLEYKFLNYENAGIQDHRIAQQLVVLGVRLHF